MRKRNKIQELLQYIQSEEMDGLKSRGKLHCSQHYKILCPLRCLSLRICVQLDGVHTTALYNFHIKIFVFIATQHDLEIFGGMGWDGKLITPHQNVRRSFYSQFYQEQQYANSIGLLQFQMTDFYVVIICAPILKNSVSHSPDRILYIYFQACTSYARFICNAVAHKE